jgi:hypothetical protein
VLDFDEKICFQTLLSVRFAFVTVLDLVLVRDL